MSKAITLGIIARLEARPGTPGPELKPNLRPAIELRAWACAPAALKTVVAGDRRLIIDKKLTSLSAATEDQLVKIVSIYDREVVAAGFQAAKESFATLLASDERRSVALGTVSDPLTKDGIAFNVAGNAVYWKGAPTDFAYPTISEPATTLVAEFKLAPGLLDAIDKTNLQLLADQTGTTVRALRTMNLSRDPKVLAELALRTINVVSVFKLEGEKQATFAELKAMVEGLKVEAAGITKVFDPKGEQATPPTDKDHMSELVDDKKRAAVIIDVEPETDPLKVKPSLYTAKEVSLADLQKNVGKYALAQWCIDMDDAKRMAKWLELRRADFQPLPDHWVPPAAEAAGEGLTEVKDEINNGKRLVVKEIKTPSSPQAIEKTDKIPDTTEQVQKLRTGQVQAGGASLKKVKASGPVTVSFKAFPNTQGVQDDEVEAVVKPVDVKAGQVLVAAGFNDLGEGKFTINRLGVDGAKEAFLAKAKQMKMPIFDQGENVIVIETEPVAASLKADDGSLKKVGGMHSHGDEAHVNTHSHKGGDQPHTHDFVTGEVVPAKDNGEYLNSLDKHLVSRPAKAGEIDRHSGRIQADFDHIDLGDRSENPTAKSLGLKVGDKIWVVYGPETESDGIPVDIENDVQDLSPVAAFETQDEAQAFFDTLPDGEYGGWVIEPETVGDEHAVAAAPKEKKKGKVGKKPKPEPKAETKAEPKEAEAQKVADEPTVGDALKPKGPGPGETEMDDSRTGHTEDFETRAKAELAKALGVDAGELSERKTYFPFDERESVSFEGAGGEYTVLHEADADDIAKIMVHNDFEGPHAEGFDLFPQDFLMHHIDEAGLKGYMESVFDEWVRQDVGELSTSEKEEWLKENGHLADKEDGSEITEAEIEAAWSAHEEDWIEAKIAEKMGDDSGETYWRENMGDDDFVKLVKDQGFFDVDGIVEEAVSVDGAGHFLSGYDSQLHEMGDGLAYVRTN